MIVSSLSLQLDEESAMIVIEDRLISALDQCGEKNNNSRLKGLEKLRKILQHHTLSLASDWSHRETMLDSLERAMKRGKTATEQVLAARCLPLFVCQVESGELLQSDRLSELLLLCRKMMMDKSVNAEVRCVCASNLAFFYFMRSHNMQSELEDSMKLLEEVFCGPPQPEQVCEAALKSWSLLMAIAHRSQFARITAQVTSRLPSLLEKPNVDLRITAGEAIALVCERLREDEDEEEAERAVATAFPEFNNMVELLERLAKDSAKSRAKSDLKKQRSSFRDVVATVRDGEDLATERVRFGDEEISLEYWCDKRVYASVCDVFGGGLNVQLRDNVVVRDIFNLGAPLPGLAPGEKKSQGQNRHQRRLANQAVAKERFVRRQQHRDKRFVY